MMFQHKQHSKICGDLAANCGELWLWQIEENFGKMAIIYDAGLMFAVSLGGIKLLRLCLFSDEYLWTKNGGSGHLSPLKTLFLVFSHSYYLPMLSCPSFVSLKRTNK
jgi:hypothetical protein